MRRMRVACAIALSLGSLASFAQDAETRLRLTPLDPLRSGAEVGVIIELAAPPLLEQRQRTSRAPRATSDALDALLGQLEGDLARIENLPARGPRANSAVEPRLRFRYKLTYAGASARVSPQSVDAIRALPYVKAVHYDAPMEAHLAQSVSAIRATQVWSDYGVRGKGVVVAIIDTGVDYRHEALGKGFGEGLKVAGGYDFVNGDADPMDDHGHGTHVAGIVAGKVAPVLGVAPEATLLAYKVLDAEGKGEASAILAAIERTMDPDGDGDLSDRADVANVSLGGPRQPDDPMVAAVERASAAGVVFTVSAGNNYSNGSIGTPGIAPSAITVAALDRDDRRAFFSSRGPVGGFWYAKPEVGAPGVGIVSAKRGTSGVITASGTSMAAPHIAGVAALLIEKHRGWTPAEVKAAIVSTAKPAFTNQTDPAKTILGAGGGRVDARDAIAATILPSPATVSFGVLQKRGEAWTGTQTVRLTNRGTATETVTIAPPAAANGATLTVAPDSVTIAPGQFAEVTLTLKMPAQTPGPNDDNLALTGAVDLGGTNASLHIPWLLVNGPVINLTVRGEGKRAVLITSRRGAAELWQEGPETIGAFLDEEGSEVAVAAAFETEGSLPRLVVLEQQPVNGYTKLTASADQAIHKVEMAGADERGVPFVSLLGSEGTSWILQEFLLWNFQLVEWTVFEPGTRAFLVSPLEQTGLRTMEVFQTARNKYATMYRVLRSIGKDETLQILPGDWASQSIEYGCRKSNCEALLAIGAGSFTLFNGIPAGTGPSSWTLFLTPRVAEEWDFRAHVMVREDDVPENWQELRVEPWTYMSPAMRNDAGRIASSPFGRKSPADYFAPSPGHSILLGDGPMVLRSIMGNRKIEIDSAGAALGESLGEKAAKVRATLFDADGNELTLLPRGAGSFLGPNDLGVFRLVATNDYTIGGRPGRVTQTSVWDKSRSLAPPTLTMLRIEDASGRYAWSAAAGSAPRLIVSARHSLYGDDFYVYHRRIDESATQLWWRRHGTQEWMPLAVAKAATDYSSQASMPGTAGTIYSADLRNAALTPGAVDLKIVVATGLGGTTEVVYEPALIVTEPQGKRRAVR